MREIPTPLGIKIRPRRLLVRRIDMAKVIEFYVPDLFPRKVKWVPSEQRGQVIEFPKSVKKSA
jgi:hypothetical protein